MVYKPENNDIPVIGLAYLIIINILLLLAFDVFKIPMIRAVLTIVFLIINVIMILYLLFIVTLKYEITKEFLTISGLFDMKKYKIPISEIDSFKKEITLLDKFSVRGLSGSRFAVGTINNSKMDKLNLFITSSKKSLFLACKDRIIGISPKNIDEFIIKLEEFGVREINKTNFKLNRYEEKDNNGRKLTRRIYFYCFVILLLIALFPIILNFLKLLPPYIKVSNFINGEVYLSIIVYLRRVLIHCLVGILLLNLSYVLILNLVSVDGKYYYHIMIVPLVFILLYSIYSVLNILNSLAM